MTLTNVSVWIKSPKSLNAPSIINSSVTRKLLRKIAWPLTSNVSVLPEPSKYPTFVTLFSLYTNFLSSTPTTFDFTSTSPVFDIEILDSFDVSSLSTKWMEPWFTYKLLKGRSDVPKLRLFGASGIMLLVTCMLLLLVSINWVLSVKSSNFACTSSFKLRMWMIRSFEISKYALFELSCILIASDLILKIGLTPSASLYKLIELSLRRYIPPPLISTNPCTYVWRNLLELFEKSNHCAICVITLYISITNNIILTKIDELHLLVSLNLLSPSCNPR